MAAATLTAVGSIPAPAAPRIRADRAFFGHPAGLGWLSFCELWERFSFYGMQALLVLYLTNYLFLPQNIGQVAGIDALRHAIESVTGPRSTQQLASAVFGLYAGFVYLTPLFGGLLADRVLGRTTTVVIGASLMALGHFLMAFEASFLIALACLLVGVGCFKGNIAAQVGDLYAPDDKRRASAFQIFLLAVQIAVILAPIVCGTLGEKVAWHWGFGAAGVGMLIGLVVYLAGRRWLPPEPVRDATTRAVAARARMTGPEKARLVLLVALVPVLMLSVVGNQQFSNAFPLWSQKNMDLVLFGWQVPVTWLQAVDAVVSTATMAGSIAFWRWWAQRRREPDELTKMGIGALIAAGRAGAAGGRFDDDRRDAREGQLHLDPRLHARQRHRLRQHPAGRPGALLASRAAAARGPADRHLLPAPVHRQHLRRLARRVPGDDAGTGLLGAACRAGGARRLAVLRRAIRVRDACWRRRTTRRRRRSEEKDQRCAQKARWHRDRLVGDLGHRSDQVDGLLAHARTHRRTTRSSSGFPHGCLSARATLLP